MVVGVVAIVLAFLRIKSISSSTSGTFLVISVFSYQSSLMFFGRAAIARDVAKGAASNCPVRDTAL